MSNIKTAIYSIVMAAGFAIGAAHAQNSENAADAPSNGAQENGDLNLGETVETEVGQTYIAENHGDWNVRCIKAPEGKDPCQLYQLIVDGSGTSVAEISFFPLPEGQRAVAGATIAAPLETLLTQQITLSVDGGEARRYPFSWCSTGGCFARVGFVAEEMTAFQRGATANMVIVPVQSPDNRVNLAISLDGFTAGYESIKRLNAE